MVRSLPLGCRVSACGGGGSCQLLLTLGGQDDHLVAQDLVREVQHALELELCDRLRRERDHDVVALVPVVDLVCEPAPAPALGVPHLPVVLRNDRSDPVRRGTHQGLVGLSRQDEHAFVLPQTPPPLVWTAPLEGEQEVLRVVQQCTGPVRKLAPRYDTGLRRAEAASRIHSAELPCTSPRAAKEARAMTNIHDLKAWKADGRRFTMLTAY